MHMDKQQFYGNGNANAKDKENGGAAERNGK